MSLFKPMLSGKFDAAVQRFPAMASPKLDGLRALAMEGKAMSRSMKMLPSRHVQAEFAKYATELEGLDGEIIVGPPNADDVYRVTDSHVMAHDKVFDFTYWVFDRWNVDAAFVDRFISIRREYLPPWVQIVPHHRIANHAELEAFEAKCLDEGYEGIMLRDPQARYKQGRGTTKAGDLLKCKRYEDAEAEILGTVEEMFNGNEAQTNELGRTKRSTAQAGLVGKGTMGALVVKGLNGPFEGVTFNIGTGFTAADRAAEWPIGSVVKYKYFNIGTKDKPRHPVFSGRRDRMDFAEPVTIKAEAVMEDYGSWA